MVLDCGGGTVDITMHRVARKEPQMLLDELAPPSGGPFGSTFVDLEFENFLKDLVGVAAFGRFKPSGEWVQLMRTWEAVKLGFDPGAIGGPETTQLINVSPILDAVEDSSLSELVVSYNARRGARLGSRGKSTLLLPITMLQNFFTPVVSKIINCVRDLLEVSVKQLRQVSISLSDFTSSAKARSPLPSTHTLARRDYQNCLLFGRCTRSTTSSWWEASPSRSCCCTVSATGSSATVCGWLCRAARGSRFFAGR